MPSHWTYSDFSSDDDLLQGDIISRSSALVEMLQGVFPYFCDERYIAFLVTTQSCDLVRRGSKTPKAKYISLAVIRELRPLLPEWMEEHCGSGFPGIYKKESRFVAEQFLRRVINQNEQASGLFYLHPDADAGIGTPAVALLRVTFALRQQHYELLTKARRGRVRAEFANKLGWLSGNLFSRIATPDWEDEEKDAEASSNQAKQLLRMISQPDEQNWVSEEWIKEAQRKRVDLDGLSPDNAYSELAQHAPLEPLEEVIHRIDALGLELLAESEVKHKLRLNTDFFAAFSTEVAEALSEISESESLRDKLVADETFCEAVCQCVSAEAKKQFRNGGESPVTALLEALRARTGKTLRPIVGRLQVILDNDFEGVDGSAVVSGLGEATVFTDAVLEHVAATVSAIESEHRERHRELAGRLRNDARVKTALRRRIQLTASGLE